MYKMYMYATCTCRFCLYFRYQILYVGSIKKTRSVKYLYVTYTTCLYLHVHVHVYLPIHAHVPWYIHLYHYVHVQCMYVHAMLYTKCSTPFCTYNHVNYQLHVHVHVKSSDFILCLLESCTLVLKGFSFSFYMIITTTCTCTHVVLIKHQ